MTRLPLVLTFALALLMGMGWVAHAETSEWQQVAKDEFGRSVSSGWGTSEAGGSYTLTVPSGAIASVTNGEGQVGNLSVGQRFKAKLPVSAADVRARSSVTATGTGVGLYHSWRVRQSSDGTACYIVTAKSSPGSGNVLLSVSRIRGGTSTWLKGVLVPATLSTSKLWLEVQVTGEAPVSVKARIWNGTTTPGWQLNHEDASDARLTSAGPVALDDFVDKAGSKVSVSHDGLLVERLVTSTPTPPPTPDPPGRGTTLGSTRYPVPAGAVIVDPVNGSDNNAGTLAAPKRSITAALGKVPAGGTVVLRAGSYHENVVVAKQVTLQNYPGEVAWLDGSSRVSNWTATGSVWVASGWTHDFDHTAGSTYLTTKYPLAAHPEQLFVDGQPLRQVSSVAQVATGTFFVDTANDKIYLGTNPAGREVRASDLQQALKIVARNVVLQGFGVRRYATSLSTRGTVQMDAAGGAFRHLVVTQNAMIGMALSNVGKTVENVTVTDNGSLGIGVNEGDGFTLRNSIVSTNNAEHFNFVPVAGGVKITATHGVTVKNNTVKDNNEGNGVWLDVRSSDFTIAGNEITGNGQVQIVAEISVRGIIANNLLTGGKSGLSVYDTQSVKVFNNNFGGQSQYAIVLRQDARWRSEGTSAYPLLTKYVTVSNNVFGCSGLYSFMAKDGETNIPADNMSITINGNLFNKKVADSDPTMVGWGNADNKTVQTYQTPAALAAAKNSSWKNAQTTSCLPLSSMSTAITSAQAVGVGLPSEVAGAIGVSTGTVRVGRF